MRLDGFTEDVAREVLGLWEFHLGFFYRSIYVKNPDLLSDSVRDAHSWTTGRYENRIGSRWSDDAKLFVYLETDESLRVECYVQSHTVFEKDREKAEEAEDAFNRDVRELIEKH